MTGSIGRQYYCDKVVQGKFDHPLEAGEDYELTWEPDDEMIDNIETASTAITDDKYPEDSFTAYERERLHSYDDCEEPEENAEDILAYDKESQIERDIFLERRDQYGNHLENDKRFPLENFCGKYLKCCRFIREAEHCVDIKRLRDSTNTDTIRDDNNYGKMIITCRERT